MSSFKDHPTFNYCVFNHVNRFFRKRFHDLVLNIHALGESFNVQNLIKMIEAEKYTVPK